MASNLSKNLSTNIFGQGRRQLTFFYSLIMFFFLAIIIVAAHKTMEWSIFSEQARELLDTAQSVSEAQAYFDQHPGLTFDEANYKAGSDRLFFYVVDNDGRLLNFSRASFRIEPFILDIISHWNASENDVSVYTKEGDHERRNKIMMTAKPVYQNGEAVQTVYVGKDVTAMYNGLRKSTYAMAALGFFALLLATVLGHILSGKTMEPLREAYEKQRQFAADASHELRTPLAVVMASADLLQNDPSITSPFLKQVIEDVRDEVKKMAKLVGDLLLVARSDNKALKLKLTRFHAEKLLSQTVRLMQPLAAKKKIVLVNRETEKHEIMADEQKVKQLMLILVDNAVKYTPEGGRVETGFLPAASGCIRFYVQDTGIGIAPEDQKRIFDRFYRVDKARSREMGGNGLGLSIAMEIVKLHQGNIKVDSEPGKGTRFTVELHARLKPVT